MNDPASIAETYLNDIRYIEANFGNNQTYSAHRDYIDFEVYTVLTPETAKQIGLALCVVIAVVLFITISLQATLIVVFCVLLVNIYMLAVTQFWGQSFNNVVAVNLSFSLGVALDYSSHIAHKYLAVKVPDEIL